jgi:iron(III) transport system permease protein
MVAFSYMMMFGRNGLLTHHLLGLNVNIFGWHGLWLSQTISFFPVSAMVIEGVLQSISPNVENAGRNLGARGFSLFRTVTLPLARPGIGGAALLVAIQVLADFGNPIMIGGNFSVLATEAWLRVEGWGDVRGAAVLSSLLLVPSLLLFVAQRTWVGRRTYATVTGRAGASDIPRTAPVVRILLFSFCALVSFLVVLVYAALLIGAFVKGWGFDWTPTLRNLEEVVTRSPDLIRSLLYAAIAGLAGTLIAITAAYITSRKVFALRRLVDTAAMLPAALPGIFFGIGYAIVFTRPPIDLYGSAAIIVLSLIFWNISMGYQSGVAAFSQISPSFGEAAGNLGATSMRIFREIEIPLIRGVFFSSFTVSFIRAATTLSVVVFLATSSNSVATFSIMNLVNDGFYGKAAALTTALLLASCAALGAARLIAGRPVELFTVARGA